MLGSLSIVAASLVLLLFQFASASSTLSQDDYVLTGEWLTSCDSTEISRACTSSPIRPFVYPTGVAIDSKGNVYVVDTWTKEIQKFTSDGKFLTRWGGPGNGDGRFQTPTGIAVDSLNNVYVIDLSLANIQKFTSEGKFLLKWGSPGNGNGQFRAPTGIALDTNGNVYVVDTWTKEIQKFTSDGKFLTRWGGPGVGDDRFGNPRGIAVDGSSNVYVVDQFNSHIQKFTSDGKFLMKWGSRCETESAMRTIVDWQLYACAQPKDDELYNPVGGISVDKDSNVYILDQYNNRIQKFTREGEFIATIPMPDYRGLIPTYSMLGHSDVEVTRSGDKVFTTALNDKVLVFSEVCYDLGRYVC